LDFSLRKDQKVAALQRQKADLFVDKASRQWVVRDPEGNFWIVPSVAKPWSHRKPFQVTEDMDLEPVPAHYQHMLDLPFK
jgi:hypothetical protein